MKSNSITQSDMNLNFDGMKGDGVNRAGNKFSGNQHSGVQNPNSTINKGRGPTGGGKSMPYCSDMISGSSHPQKRQAVSDGSTKSMPALGKESFNYGRGPTKGNQL